MSEKDSFISLNNKYPKVNEILKINPISIDKIKDECIFILDTNILFIPYKIKKESMDEIKKIYQILISKNQLIIPAHIIREFIKNRPTLLNSIHQKLKNFESKNKFQRFTPECQSILKSDKNFPEILEIEKKIQDDFNKYNILIKKLIENVESWKWNDPITQMYSDLFNDSIVFELDIAEEKLKNELVKRNRYQIPPGYLDKNKYSNSEGDLLIWLYILEIGKKKKKFSLCF